MQRIPVRLNISNTLTKKNLVIFLILFELMKTFVLVEEIVKHKKRVT